MAVYHAQCHDYHDTADEARACAGAEGGRGIVRRQGHTLDRRPHAERVSPARSASSAGLYSPKQAKLIRTLWDEREVPQGGRTPEEANLLERGFDILGNHDEFDPEHDKSVSGREASAVIDFLFTLPRKRPSTSDGPAVEVPAGKYALLKQDGTVKFVKVDRPTEGRWAGYVFVNLLVGAPGRWREIKLPRDAQKATLAEIGKDVLGATVLFGRKSESCGQCDSPLSHLCSRAAGYGKICADKKGWHYPSEAEARQILQELGLPLETSK